MARGRQVDLNRANYCGCSSPRVTCRAHDIEGG
jgi:hypothetical protein